MGLRWGAVVLAAGAGSRMGTRPKCLLQIEGQSLIQRHLATLKHAGVVSTAVVLGHHAAAIHAAVPDAEVVTNASPDEGQNGSLHLGLQALPGDVEAVVVMLADQPLVDVSALQDLQEAFVKSDAQIEVLVPWHIDKQVPGNPVAFSARVCADILKSPAPWGCKQWQQAHPAHVQQWVTTNPAYFIDLDTPEDITAFERHSGMSLRWPCG